MNIKLEHKFRYEYNGNWDNLLKEVKSLQQFMIQIEKHCGDDAEYLSNKDEKQRMKDKFRGAAFEVFAEMLLKSHSSDQTLGISDYSPNFDEDFGIDGFGTGTNLNPATVQVKYRGDPKYELKGYDDRLVGFMCASQNCKDLARRVNVDDHDNMLVITSAIGIHWLTEEKMLHNKVRCCGRPQLKKFVDNNLPFWRDFRFATSEISSPILLKEPI